MQQFYTKDEPFKFYKRIEQLSYGILSINENFLVQKTNLEKIFESILVNLFTQIKVYAEEVQRLNIKIKNKNIFIIMQDIPFASALKFHLLYILLLLL